MQYNDCFVWVPTQNGLFRFDGYDTLLFKVCDNSFQTTTLQVSLKTV